MSNFATKTGIKVIFQQITLTFCEIKDSRNCYIACIATYVTLTHMKSKCKLRYEVKFKINRTIKINNRYILVIIQILI